MKIDKNEVLYGIKILKTIEHDIFNERRGLNHTWTEPMKRIREFMESLLEGKDIDGT